MLDEGPHGQLEKESNISEEYLFRQEFKREAQTGNIEYDKHLAETSDSKDEGVTIPEIGEV